MGQKILPFTGAAAALITPFTCDGAVDYPALERLIELQICEGIDALVVLGTTGEASTLTHEERLAVTAFTVRTVRGRLPVIVGTGSNNTAYSVELSREVCRLGADALLVVTPYYNKASPEGLKRHFTAIAEASSCPIILYNVPGRTGMSIPMQVYAQLAEVENIAAVKEASGSLASAADLCASFGDALYVYSGNDELTLPILSVGGKGVISAAANIVPREMHAICAHFFSNHIDTSRAVQHSLTGLIRALFSDVNPIPLKCACSLLGLCRETMRLPLCPMGEDKRHALEEEMKKIGLFERF
ncbi:MAG: 4-hydroxy-tetrahydrodipicolinate synthase [Clostridia bacterium]|nr:4-hydroxy-tetrahydrodipicolinate synthase [Clostridia bacterium]